MIKKILILAASTIWTSGCVHRPTATEYCLNLGLKPGTDQYANCALRYDEMRTYSRTQKQVASILSMPATMHNINPNNTLYVHHYYGW